MPRYQIRYTVPIEVVAYVDAPDDERAALAADGLVREALSQIDYDRDGVRIVTPVDLPDPDDETEVHP